MAASFSITLTCKNCGRGSITITNAYEGAGALASALENNRFARCTICGYPVKAKLASITAHHSGNIGSHTGLTHTITNGSISSATAG